MRLSVCGVFVLVTAYPAFCQDQTALERRGETLLSRHCAMCHAVGRSGGSPQFDAPPFRAIGDRYPLDRLEEALRAGLQAGHPGMPKFTFDASDARSILTYLRSIQER